VRETRSELREKVDDLTDALERARALIEQALEDVEDNESDPEIDSDEE
jgi:predicted transcriptional regulator